MRFLVAVVLCLVAAPIWSATIHVNTLTDEQTTGSATCSLREAIRNANSTTGDLSGGDCVAGEVAAVDTIVFDVTGTIILTIVETPFENFLPPIAAEATAGALVLQGPGAGSLAIDGGTSVPELRLLDVAAGARLSVSDLTLTHGGGAGLSHRGAGLRVQGGVVSVQRVTLSGNLTNQDGGAIAVEGGSVEVSQSTITGNSGVSISRGGGIFLGGGDLRITDSEISANNAGGFSGDGGGIGCAGGSIEIANSTISGNTSATSGGGLAAVSATDVRLVNVTVTGNRAPSGGGIGGEGLELHNSLVAGNTALDGVTPSDCLLPSLPWLANDGNLFGSAGNAAGCPTGNANDVYPVVSLQQILDPMLADNGGPTSTHALVEYSPALGRANASVCAAAPPGGVGGVDQRGQIRPPQSCDIGAFELASTIEVPTLSPWGIGALAAGLGWLAARRLSKPRRPS